MPALMALAACRSTNAKLLFDIRGFWVDERVDGGLWPRNGWLYRTAKRVEKAIVPIGRSYRDANSRLGKRDRDLSLSFQAASPQFR